MASNLPDEFNKFSRSSGFLRNLLKKTTKALKEIEVIGLFQGEEVEDEGETTSHLEHASRLLEGRPAVVVLGQSCEARARFVNALLGTRLLPTSGGSWRWVRISYGDVSHVALTVGMEFEVVEDLQAYEKPWITVPEKDLLRPHGEDMAIKHLPVVEVQVCHPLVAQGVTILVAPCLDLAQPDERASLSYMLQCDSVLPLLVYAMNQPKLRRKNVAELTELKQLLPESPMFFVTATNSSSSGGLGPGSDTTLTESEQHQRQLQHSKMSSQSRNLKMRKTARPWRKDARVTSLVEQLGTLGFLCSEEAIEPAKIDTERYEKKSRIVSGLEQLSALNVFVKGVLKSHLVTTSHLLNQVHCSTLQKITMCAYDKAREIQVTPRRMRYSLQKGTYLYRAFYTMTNEKQDELSKLIENTLKTLQPELLEEAANHQYKGAGLLADGEIGPVGSLRAVHLAVEEIQQLVLSRLSRAVAQRIVSSMNCLQESAIGTLFRTLCSLERDAGTDAGYVSNIAEPAIFQEIKDVFREDLNLSSFNCHGAAVSNNPVSLRASDALKQLLTAAYSVQLYSGAPSSSLHSFVERMRLLCHSVQLPWSTPPRLDALWRRRVALDILKCLCPERLAKTVSSQFKEQVHLSHVAYLAALKDLASTHMEHIERAEEQRSAIRGRFAPILARLAFTASSIADAVQNGMPKLGKEIGRGQYGVVYSCESWGQAGPCAVKSVVPNDDHHRNDLAMEFYYSRSIPEHARIVRLRGAVLDYTYSGGCSPAVLLVMDQLNRDLYSGLNSGLPWLTRLQIVMDVAEGIRFLHSLGLIHRDIKLKNVLLDTDNRAKLSDMGFCIPEAIMSGSVVGTPVHMAPEMQSGIYDSSVDVYAFGILLWYVCAGSVRLPLNFGRCKNKEELWINIKKGVRPERLAQFDSDCWELMEACWSRDRAARPLLGSVQQQLEMITARHKNQNEDASTSGAEALTATGDTISESLCHPYTNSLQSLGRPRPMTIPIPASAGFWHHVREA